MASPEELPSYGVEQFHKAVEFLADVELIEWVVLIQPAILDPNDLRRLQKCGIGVATIVLRDGNESYITYTVDETTPEMRRLAEIAKQEEEGESPDPDSAEYVDNLVNECLGIGWQDEEYSDKRSVHYNTNLN